MTCSVKSTGSQSDRGRTLCRTSDAREVPEGFEVILNERKSQMKSTAKALLLICAAALITMTNGAAADPTGSGTGQNSIEGTWLAKVTTPNPPPGLPPAFL